jgi:hypothetical protein
MRNSSSRGWLQARLLSRPSTLMAAQRCVDALVRSPLRCHTPGFPSVGKSTLLTKLTGTFSEVSAHWTRCLLAASSSDTGQGVHGAGSSSSAGLRVAWRQRVCCSNRGSGRSRPARRSGQGAAPRCCVTAQAPSPCMIQHQQSEGTVFLAGAAGPRMPAVQLSVSFSMGVARDYRLLPDPSLCFSLLNSLSPGGRVRVHHSDVCAGHCAVQG